MKRWDVEINKRYRGGTCLYDLSRITIVSKNLDNGNDQNWYWPFIFSPLLNFEQQHYPLDILQT